MAKLEKSVMIDAPVEEVFEYLHPDNLTEIWPSLVENKDVQQLPNGGYSSRWVYKMAGVRLEGAGEDTEFIPNRRIVTKTKGGVDSTFVWSFKPEDGGTRLDLSVEYTIPIPVLGKVAEAFVVKVNNNEMETLLANLKAKMET